MPARRTTRTLLAALVVAGLTGVGLTAAAPAGADEACTVNWAGGTGAWNDAARWSPAGVPTPDDVVCIGRAVGAPMSTVRVTGIAEAAELDLTGATLAIAPGATVLAGRVTANRATLTGGGTLVGTSGTTLTDTRLAGARVVAQSHLGLEGRITVTSGGTVAAFGTGGIDLRPGLQVVDADGNPRNHLEFSKFPLYLTGTVFLGVRTALVDTVLFAQGDVTLAALDNLDADGVLRPAPSGRTLQLGTGGDGRLQLPRTITAIARGVSVTGGRVDTADGFDALSTLATVDGSLGLDRSLSVSGALVVRGRLGSSSSVSADRGIAVRRTGSFTAPRVDGALTSAGSCALSGSRIGRLTLLPGSTTTTDLDTPLAVGGRATLAGTLTVQLRSGRQPALGTSLVLLTAAQGVTGRFDTVVTDRPDRMAVTPDYQPTWLSGTVAAPAG